MQSALTPGLGLRLVFAGRRIKEQLKIIKCDVADTDGPQPLVSGQGNLEKTVNEEQEKRKVNKASNGGLLSPHAQSFSKL